MCNLRTRRRGPTSSVSVHALEPRLHLAAQLVRDINAVNPGSHPSSFVPLNGAMLFQAQDEAHGFEWWRTDGTAANTRVLKDIWPGTGSGVEGPHFPGNNAVVGNTLFFRGSTPGTGIELWKTDGTEAGTVLVTDINPGPESSGPQSFVVAGNAVCFTAWTPDREYEVWKSDGTAAGTVRITSFPALGASAVPIGAIGSRLVFAGGTPRMTYYTDGTPGDYRLLAASSQTADQAPDPSAVGPYTPGRGAAGAVIDGLLYFASASSGGGWGGQLWRTDGTPAGTVRVSSFPEENRQSRPTEVFKVGDSVYVATGEPGINGAALYRLDGNGGQTLVAGAPNLNDGIYYFMYSGHRLLAFRPTDRNEPLAGHTLYRLDPAAGALVPLVDLGPFITDRGPAMTVGRHTYFFTDGRRGFPEYHLWRTDGTPQGTGLVRAFVPPRAIVGGDVFPSAGIAHDGTMFFGLGGDGGGVELWRTDGTAAGTFRVARFERANGLSYGHSRRRRRGARLRAGPTLPGRFE